MNKFSWKEGFQFALAYELQSDKAIAFPYAMQPLEKFGNKLLAPLYKIIDFLSKKIKEPLAICLFTLLAALIAGLVFYNIPAFMILGELFPSQSIRFLLFFYFELNLFAMGCRAVSRFNNKALISLWKEGRLVAIFPGDQTRPQ